MEQSWRGIAPSITAHSLHILFGLGWNSPAEARRDFFKSPAAFLATLESTSMVPSDIQSTLIICFASLIDGMQLEVAWDENGSEVWYPCILRKLPLEMHYLAEKGAGTPEWWNVEPGIRASLGPWHVTSTLFDGSDIILFDPFRDTFRCNNYF